MMPFEKKFAYPNYSADFGLKGEKSSGLDFVTSVAMEKYFTSDQDMKPIQSITTRMCRELSAMQFIGLVLNPTQGSG